MMIDYPWKQFITKMSKIDFESCDDELCLVLYASQNWYEGKYKTEREFGLQEQARKALEGALSGKKNEFDKWDKEIKRREELGGGGSSGGGGWFGWGGRFGWSNDDNFWQEAKQAGLTILALVLVVRGFLIPV